ncbi:hypothetical protein E2C01_070735 [Portunus trituberculatus]|uniref:Uncharacterized protein n=1 Tax=Portunus trituberculatus TaxID=210409 RepID=A0A5B7I2X8_PORTR|nr:hypothetical protein [Portunus trituberculatus]
MASPGWSVGRASCPARYAVPHGLPAATTAELLYGKLLDGQRSLDCGRDIPPQPAPARAGAAMPLGGAEPGGGVKPLRGRILHVDFTS